MSEHAWVQENLVSYITGGLTTAEGEQLERHTAGCKDCGRALGEWRGFDERLSHLFAGVRPEAGWESRVIEKLRTAPARRQRRWSSLLRSVGAAAAILILAGIGFFCHNLVAEDMLPFPGFAVSGGEISERIKVAFLAGQPTKGRMEHRLHGLDLALAGEYDNAPPQGTMPGSGAPGKDSPKPQVFSAYSETINGKKETESLASVNRIASGLEELKELKKANESYFQKRQDLVEKLTKQLRAPISTTTITDETYRDRKPQTEGQVQGESRPTTATPPPPPAAKEEPLASGGKTRTPPMPGMPGGGQRGFGGGGGKVPGASGPGGLPPADAAKFTPPTPPADPKAARQADLYFKLAKDAPVSLSDLDKSPEKNEALGKKGAKGEAKEETKRDSKKGGEGAQVGQDKQELAPVTRKIIRTGEVEFEIENFDSAVGGLTRLVTGIPGAFIATINSEKLPNGKVRGSVIVRMPPDNLDKFLLDLRQELGKVGELKSQRIGSQDITKQFYDVESRLRAARTMEERLIAIIKTGKGEIKDLLNAERELGVWRTKIEEMEGEIRYYSNQVSLSTLTITLYEKEIRAAAALVVTEHVTMRIETEDVDKALQTALTAVTEAKGRITKSDMKQHVAGQYEAILQFEVTPAAAGTVKDKLKKLGIVTHHDTRRQQTTEGGGTAATEIKSRQNDVQFHVTLYNVANIQPRESYILHVASQDVAADYYKLQDAVAQAKGQVRNANLSEQDKLNVTGQFDFDVPATARETIDKLLVGLGDVTSRTTSRAAPGETATDRKVGYRLTLRNVASIPPRESFIVQVASQDVPADYHKLQDAVAKAKGQIRNANLMEQDKLNVTAQLDFDVPASVRETIDKMLVGLGDVTSRTTSRAAPGETATDRKVGYRLTLRNIAGIPPRESYIVQVASQDVPTDYHKLHDAVAKAKGHIRNANLSEQDKVNVTAQLDFDVPATARETIDKLLAELGDITGRTTARATAAEGATDRKVGYRLTLRNVGGIPPRETYTMQAVSQDVPNAFRKLQEAVAQAKGNVRSGFLKEQDKLNVTAQFDFDIPVTARSNIDQVLAEIGEVYTRTTDRTPPGDNATDRKVGYRLSIRNVAGIPPREKISLEIEVKDVELTMAALKAMVSEKAGSVAAAHLKHEANGQVTALLLFDVPLPVMDELVRKFKGVGTVRVSQTTPNPQVPDTKLATAQIVITMSSQGPIVPRDEGLWQQIRTSLFYSFKLLSWSLMFIILGLCVLLPWALVLWAGGRLIKRWKKSAAVGS